MESPCSKTDFICHKANTFINTDKQVIYSNNTTGPWLTTNVVSVIQCIFSLLGAMELALTCFKASKVAFKFAFELIYRFKFIFDECKF